MSVVIRAVGSALPARAVPNDDLPAALETSDEWIKSRTGIAQRYIAADDETTSSLAIAAARSALDSAGLKADDIDGIIVATTTPDLTFPAVATMVQRELGVPAGTLAFDVQAVCAGFIYAVGVADGLLQAGRMRRAIVIGSETMTRILNWEDRTTCVLFGDGGKDALIGLMRDVPLHVIRLEAVGVQQVENGAGHLFDRVSEDFLTSHVKMTNALGAAWPAGGVQDVDQVAVSVHLQTDQAARVRAGQGV